jgi:hypothetical protein
MGIRHERQLHVRITKRSDDELARVASLEGTTKSELVRQVLWNFTRGYCSAHGQSTPQAATTNVGTQVVPSRYRIR